MDEIAETGIAAHFLYATNKSSTLVGEKEKKLLEHYEDISEEYSQHSFIYCITPDGDIKRLSPGSSARDFAQKIHSTLAKKSRYALVNDEQKSMNYKVQNFDIVELIT